MAVAARAHEHLNLSAVPKLAACLLIGLSLAPSVDASNGKRVTFESGGLTLVGFLYQPEGDGPWPAALSWDQNDWLKTRLIEAVGRTDIPVLLIQPAKDASLAPGRVLGLEASRRGKPLIVKVYPATGAPEEQSHCFGGARGMHVWAEDAKAFFERHLR